MSVKAFSGRPCSRSLQSSHMKQADMDCACWADAGSWENDRNPRESLFFQWVVVQYNNPAAFEGASSRGSRLVNADSHNPATILVVDDHDDSALLLSLQLEDCGFRIISAPTYRDALALAQQEAVDLLVTDIDLPDGDGCILLSELRALRPEIRGVAYTGHGMPHHLQRYHSAGFTAALIKPVVGQEVRDTITKALAASLGAHASGETHSPSD